MYTNNNQLDQISESAKERWLWLTDEMIYRKNSKRPHEKLVVEEVNYRKFNIIIGACVAISIIVFVVSMVVIKIGIDKLLN